jgi:hypothetical protein
MQVRNVGEKRSSLLGLFVGGEEKSFITLTPAEQSAG